MSAEFKGEVWETYIVFRQVGETHDGEIRINPDEWPALKAAIEEALSNAK